MPLNLPMTLSGDNLGERHRYLNLQVNQVATAGQVSFQDIEALTEQTAVDRLIKIDLAIKLKNVDFILKNLKDDDMLYVSRALKCKWLLERRDIINPKYLEDALFPQMVLPAISKFKHWLYIHLTDPLVCQEFYEYYKNIKFDFAVKFLCHVDNEFLLKEFPKILTQINPHYLKVLGEKCPKLVKIYYDSFSSDIELVKRYIKDEQAFYKSIKFLLKSDPDIFFDILEKYNSLTAPKLSPGATKHILHYHKNRFMEKSELYIVYLLHMPTVAQCLSVEECQEQVIKLARAEYLSWWFSYANVEPLVKRVGRDSRAAFKKRVFVAKDVGERVAEWPYTLPASPVVKDSNTTDSHAFLDQDYEPIQMGGCFGFRQMLKRKKCCAYSSSFMESECIRVKSELQKLFDEFRFVGFDGTLHELRGRINAASSADRRRDMLLVLVSKSGGRPDCVRTMLQLALRLRNEPVHERAAIVRSLVKRANAWRLPQDVWDSMLEYGQGLGLDGTKSEAQCREGLHAVVLRQLLATGDCEEAVRTAFLEDFSTLEEYKLTTTERSIIASGLQHILMSAANDAKPEVSASYLDRLLDVLEKYRISFQSVVSTIKTLADRDSEVARSLLQRLFEARVGRRELLRQYLAFKHDDAALTNVLRHDPSALEFEWLVKLLTDGETRANQFFLKMAVYFNETNGIAEQVCRILLDKVVEAPDVKLARPLATLAGRNMESIMQQQDLAGKERHKLAAALRANMHLARPAPDAFAFGWRKSGMKAVAWRAIRCRPSEVTQVIQTLLQERVKRTVRLALVLAQRTPCAVDIYSTAVTIKPLAALRAALPYYRNLGESADPRIYDIVKPYIASVDLTTRQGLRHVLKNYDWVPNAIKPEYCAVLCLILNKISDNDAGGVRRYLMKCLPQVSDDLLKNVLMEMLAKIDASDPESFPAIVMRYLMLSKSDDEVKSRFKQVGQPFLEKITAFRQGEDDLRRQFFKDNLHQILASLQYNAAFFEMKYNCCLVVFERVLTWLSSLLAKETHFEEYIKIHSSMLYFKAIRQSMKQNPEIFADPAKKLTEGVDIVGFTFGRYVVKEVAELKSKYFDSVIELYRNAFTDYLSDYFLSSVSKGKFIAALTKGILSESVGSETRLAVHVLHTCRYNLEDSVKEEIKELCLKKEDKEVLFFMHAEIYA